MANGDTKTNQYLDIAANGNRADLPSDTCCETRTQTLIRGVAERIMDVEDEVERLENNPDVVDIVDTYADLQAYSTSGLTDKDIVRVIADETKGGLSSYYRWNSPDPGWNFVGVIPGGDGIKVLSSADYNYPTANPDRVALWLLDNGLYTAPAGVMVAASTTSYPWYNTSDKTILVGGSDTVKGIYTFLNGKTDVVTTQVSDGTEADEYTLLKSDQVLQATGQSTTDTMSQKAITDMLANAGTAKVLTEADYNYPADNPNKIAVWLLEPGVYTWGSYTARNNTSFARNDPISFFNDTFRASTTTMIIGYRTYTGQSLVTCIGDNGRSSNDLGGYFSILRYTIFNKNDTTTSRIGNATYRGADHLVSNEDIVNNLTSTSSHSVLSAAQGKVLNDRIGNLANLTTTDKTSAVAAINELASSLGGLSLVSISQTDYDALATKDPNTLYIITGA